MARDRDDDGRSSRSSRNDGRNDGVRGFRYERRSVDDARKRASERSGNFESFLKGDFKKYKIKDGKNIVRILPPTWPKPKHYAYTIHVNYKIGADNRQFLSLSEMKGEKDPLAEARKEAQREGDKAMAKALAPQKRSLMWIIDRMDEDEGPQLFDCPFGVDTKFVNLAIDEDTKEVIYVDDPEEGCDIRFYREQKSKDWPDYPADKMRILKPSPISQDEGLQKEWLEFVTDNPVPDCLVFHDYDYIQECFDGVIGKYDEDNEKGGKAKADDEDDERPARGRSRQELDDGDDGDARPARRRPAAEDDDGDGSAKQPARRSRERLEPDDDDGDQKPRGNHRRDSQDDDDGAEDTDTEGKSRPGIRERLQKRRAEARSDD